MTKEAAIHNFWSSFGIPAYEENSVYAMAEQGNAPTFPYITYEVITGSMGAVIPLTASIWYRSVAWNAANEKKRQVESAFEGDGGKCLYCDNGHIRLYKGNANNTGDPTDDMVKRVIINYSAVFNTID